MAIFEWRKFNFFDLRHNVDEGKVAEVFKDATITAATSGNNQFILCDSFGLVHIFTKTWSVTSFKAHDSPITLCELVKQNNFLVTVGTEDNGSVPVFKVWNLTKATKGGGLLCLKTVKTILQKPTVLAVSDSGHYLAIGFDRGSISLYRGDITRDRFKTQKTLSGGISTITGIAFMQTGKIVQMFICSDAGVLVYNLQHKDKEVKTILDNDCAPRRCCGVQLSPSCNEAHFMVGRDDAVYCYTVDGRGPCYALDGYKSIIQCFRSHLVSVAKSQATMSSQKDSTITIIDILNKFIVFSSPIDAVAAVLIEFGSCFIITKNREVLKLDEKDLQSKLNLLFKKNLYGIAVRIAKSHQYDSEGLTEIFKQYGDYLYSKGDFAGAVDQYVKTFGYLEPSYVVKRFLDSRHIQYLTDYLQALHSQGHATADHTTLLLNCFTRLDRTDQLKEFLLNDQNPDIIFDLDVAIKVCRNASVEHALSLAKRNGKYNACISILTEDMQAYEEAIVYISNLPFDAAEESLQKHGTILMENCPEKTTELLKKLCTNYRSKNDGEFLDSNLSVERAKPEDFLHLFVRNPERLIDILEHLVFNLSNCSQAIFNTLIEHYLQRWKNDEMAAIRLMEILQKYGDTYDQMHVLVLCRFHEYWPGIMLIYEEQKLYHLIVRHYLKNHDYNNLLKTCERLGPSQPSLWLQALTGLRTDKLAPPNLVTQILQVIAKEKLQSPLQVLNCLAVDNGPYLFSVRDYFLQVFSSEDDSLKQEEEMVEKYRNESIALKNHIKILQESPLEFRGTICNTCNQPLTLPALYFLCQHSFHQDCIRGYSENDKDCPVCHSKNMQLVDALRAQYESRDQHDAFHNLLDRSLNPFSVVSEYFGRGLFNKIVIVSDDDMPQEINQNFIESYPKPREPQSNPYSRYGMGAEAKIRLTEHHPQTTHPDLAVKIPTAEGRMRSQESNVYSKSQENRHRSDIKIKPIITTSNLKTSEISGKNQPQPQPPLPQQQQKPYNPFDEDDADYDKSKNPFAEDETVEEDEKSEKLDTYDSNLNPFE